MDALNDRMKEYEARDSQKVMPLLPICARIDGRCFHKFCKRMKKPFDPQFRNIMGILCSWLVEETNATIGYTQSDEISLIWIRDKYEDDIFFGGKVQKMVSQLAAMASVEFNNLYSDARPNMATFDARVWQVPTIIEASNVLLWRECDAVRNSIQSAARAIFSHNQCIDKNSDDLLHLLRGEGIKWDDYEDRYKRGLYFRRIKVEQKFTKQELEDLPPKHEARENPELRFSRTEIKQLDIPMLLDMTLDERVCLLFGVSP